MEILKMELEYRDLMNIYESLNRAIRANEMGKARTKVPSKAGDKKEAELQSLYRTREKIGSEIYCQQTEIKTALRESVSA